MRISESKIFSGKPSGARPSKSLPSRGALLRRPNLVNVAPLRLPNRGLHPTKCDEQPQESILQTRSDLSAARFLGTLMFLLLTVCILTHSELSLSYAAMGLKLWFERMIPSLLPFMILSGIVIRLGLTESIASFIYPLIRPVYRVRKNVCYCMLLGFLCGFPMGARVVADLYTRGQLTREEGEYLLAFCNNIGPVYYCSFVLPLLHRELAAPYLFGMYGIPALYGIFLRYTRYRGLEKLFSPGAVSAFRADSHGNRGRLQRCNIPLDKNPSGKRYKEIVRRGERLLSETDQSINAGLRSILTLGGYMILFNLLNLIPHVLLGRPAPLPAPLLEITGGLSLLQAQAPLYSLLALSFGGFSCIAQTYSCIRDTGLSIVDYTLHKILLTLFNGVFYLGWFLLSPASFLR